MLISVTGQYLPILSSRKKNMHFCHGRKQFCLWCGLCCTVCWNNHTSWKEILRNEVGLFQLLDFNCRLFKPTKSHFDNDLVCTYTLYATCVSCANQNYLLFQNHMSEPCKDRKHLSITLHIVWDINAYKMPSSNQSRYTFHHLWLVLLS